MSYQVDTALVQQYRSNFDILSQQKGSRLRPYVRVESQQGEYQFFDRINATTAQLLLVRHADTPLISTPHDRRRCGLSDYVWADLIDEADLEKMLSDPASAYTQNAVYSFGRAQDQAIITAATAIAYSGKNGATAVPFPATQDIAVTYVESGPAVNSNLTIGKLRAARSLFGVNEAVEDGDSLVAVVSQAQIDSLLRTTEVTNADYNTVRALVAGNVDTFMGFKFVRTQLLTVAASIRECLFWNTRGMLLSIGTDTKVRVGERADKNYSNQVFVEMGVGSVRMEEVQVVRVYCDETV